MDTTACAQLRAAKARRGLTNAALASRLGVKAETVSRWIRGATDPTGPQLAELARILDISLDELMAPPAPPPASVRVPVLGRATAGPQAAEEPPWIEAGRLLLVDLEVRILVRRVRQ
jgi:transcriptional regulator with XRE-family HTH domain